MTRLSEDTPSKDFIISKINIDDFKSRFNKGHETKIRKILKKIFSSILYGVKKTIYTLMFIAVFSWFNLQNIQFVEGLRDLALGDLGPGVSKIFNLKEAHYVISEVYQVSIGKDYDWLKYRWEKSKDLSKDFTYIGAGGSITKSVVTLDMIVPETCAPNCSEPATYATLEEANKFCFDKYGAHVPTYNQLDKAIGRANPVTYFHLDKNEKIAEWTSTPNPSDSDEFMVFYKNQKQAEDIKSETSGQNGVYLDEDSEARGKIGFRCFINL